MLTLCVGTHVAHKGTLGPGHARQSQGHTRPHTCTSRVYCTRNTPQDVTQTRNGTRCGETVLVIHACLRDDARLPRSPGVFPATTAYANLTAYTLSTHTQYMKHGERASSPPGGGIPGKLRCPSATCPRNLSGIGAGTVAAAVGHRHRTRASKSGTWQANARAHTHQVGTATHVQRTPPNARRPTNVLSPPAWPEAEAVGAT